MEKSLPSRGRGLKSSCSHRLLKPTYVAPFTGAWIEIDINIAEEQEMKVAPFTGAWIEIWIERVNNFVSNRSLPSRGRGLKFYMIHGLNWTKGRSLHGGVD